MVCRRAPLLLLLRRLLQLLTGDLLIRAATLHGRSSVMLLAVGTSRVFDRLDVLSLCMVLGVRGSLSLLLTATRGLVDQLVVGVLVGALAAIRG